MKIDMRATVSAAVVLAAAADNGRH